MSAICSFISSLCCCCCKQSSEEVPQKEEHYFQFEPDEAPPPSESELVKAVWSKNEWLVRTLLEQGEDPNKDNLLPRLIMARIPTETYDEFDTSENEDENIKKFAEFLVQNGAVLDSRHVQEFITFQKELDPQLTPFWENYFQNLKKAKQVFARITKKYEKTDNPFIKIVNEAVNDKSSIPACERRVCSFAAQLLPQLQLIEPKK